MSIACCIYCREEYSTYSAECPFCTHNRKINQSTFITANNLIAFIVITGSTFVAVENFFKFQFAKQFANDDFLNQFLELKSISFGATNPTIYILFLSLFTTLVIGCLFGFSKMT